MFATAGREQARCASLAKNACLWPGAYTLRPHTRLGRHLDRGKFSAFTMPRAAVAVPPRALSRMDGRGPASQLAAVPTCRCASVTDDTPGTPRSVQACALRLTNVSG